MKKDEVYNTLDESKWHCQDMEIACDNDYTSPSEKEKYEKYFKALDIALELIEKN